MLINNSISYARLFLIMFVWAQIGIECGLIQSLSAHSKGKREYSFATEIKQSEISEKILKKLKKQCAKVKKMNKCAKEKFKHNGTKYTCAWDYVRTSPRGGIGCCYPSVESCENLRSMGFWAKIMQPVPILERSDTVVWPERFWSSTPRQLSFRA
ncbi:hypothetical protein niasHS_015908 [Heterodera schachtii]|uniref:Secreted protein n=1 Tax=Heterodera schachtii TaxID=97005 RepID=A0ABD2HPP3_HETSC